jgi:repressor of nif and glnA expression
LTIDLSASTVSSALYGDTTMNNNENSQGVCVNVGLLLEPKVAGTITEKGKPPVAVPQMVIEESDTVMPGDVSQTSTSVTGVIAQPSESITPTQKPNQ